jgi:hypothetical protein
LPASKDLDIYPAGVFMAWMRSASSSSRPYSSAFLLADNGKAVIRSINVPPTAEALMACSYFFKAACPRKPPTAAFA